MDAITFADSVGSIFASRSMESVGLAAGMSLGRDTAGAGAACAAATRGSPLRLDRDAARGSMGTVSGGTLPADRAGPGWDVGVYMISELCADAVGRGEPLMRSGAVAGTPADASVRPCTSACTVREGEHRVQSTL